jgi:hypothetical protein
MPQLTIADFSLCGHFGLRFRSFLTMKEARLGLPAADTIFLAKPSALYIHPVLFYVQGAPRALRYPTSASTSPNPRSQKL